MAEKNLSHVILVFLISLAVGWFVMWLIASYVPLIVVDPIKTVYYNIPVLGWLGIVFLIVLILVGIVVFKVKPRKGKKGGSALITAVIIGLLLGMFLSWIIACYVPALLITV